MKGLLDAFHVLSPTPCLMRFIPLALACLHCSLDHMTFPLAGSGHHYRKVESMSRIALRRRSLRSRVGSGPQIRSGVRQLHWCGLGISTRSGPPHIGRTQEDARCARSWCSKTTKATSCSTCAPSFMAGYMMGSLQWLWRNAGAWYHDDRSRTLSPSMYSWRCTSSLPWSVWGVDRECNLTDELVNGYLEAVALAAPKPKANSTACCKHSMGLEVDIGWRSASRHGARELH